MTASVRIIPVSSYKTVCIVEVIHGFQMVYMYNITFGTTGNADRNAAMGAAVGVLMAITVLFVFFAVNRLIKDEDVEF